MKKGTLYSKGTPEERAAWSLKLQMRKMEKKVKLNECGVLELLLSMQSQSRLSSGFKLRISKRGSLFTPKGLVNATCVKATHRGNRFVTSFNMTDFLEMSFGKLSAKKSNVMSKQLQQRSVHLRFRQFKQLLLAPSWRVKPACLRICSNFASNLHPQCLFALREAFDETGHHVTVNFGFGNEKTVSQICVIHHFMLLSWVNGGVRKTKDVIG